MTIRKYGFMVLISIIISVLAAGSLAGCAAGPTQEKTVAYLSLADYTAAIAGLNVAADMGCEDYFKNLNEKGGVDGVKVKFIGVDTRYDAARAVSAYKRYRTEPKLLFTNMIGTHINKAVAPIQFEQDKIPGFCPADGYYVASPGMGFLWGISYQDGFSAFMDWAVKDWKAKGKSDLPIIGYMGWDNAYGKEPLNGGLEYAQKIGIKLLPPEYFPPGSLDHSVYLNRLAGGGANYIYVGGIDPNPSNALRDAYKLGLTKTIQFSGDFYGPDDQVGVKLHPEATEGSVKVMWCICGEDGRNHPWAQLYPKYRGKPVSDMSAYYVTGQLWSYKFEKGLKKALATVGYDKLNGEAMYQAFQQLTGIEQEGAQGPIAYDKTQRRGSWEYLIYRVQNGKNIRIQDWTKAPDAVSLHKW